MRHYTRNKDWPQERAACFTSQFVITANLIRIPSVDLGSAPSKDAFTEVVIAWYVKLHRRAAGNQNFHSGDSFMPSDKQY